MKKIEIKINEAKILSFEVKLKDEMPDVCATIGLFAGDKQISSFSLRTESYYGDSVKFDLPLSFISPIKELAEKFEEVLANECGKQFLKLPSPKKHKK